MMSKARRLRQCIEGPELLVMPGAFDPMSARIIEKTGYDAVQCSGLGISGTLLGKPDYSMLAMSDMALATQRIAEAVDIPVMADGDTGFGNAVNVFFTIRAFEAAGAAGINLEDQVMPKRCGHLDGKEVIPVEEAVAKIKAAADARVDPDFVINARTDALGVEGIEAVIRRGNAYLEAGATMIFVEGIASKQAIAQVTREIRGPVGVNIVHGGKSGDFDLADLQEIGVARVSLPGVLIQSAYAAMEDCLLTIRDSGKTGTVADRMYPFHKLHDLMGTPEVNALEEKYLAPLKQALDAR